MLSVRRSDFLTASLGAFVVVGVATAASLQAGDVRPPPPVTFNHDIAPILHANCATCHRPGESAPFSLLTFADAKQRAALIADVTRTHVMPPWQPESAEGEFAGERRLEPGEINLLRRWVEDGAVEGDSSDRPTPPAFPAGWQLGKPDLVVSMSQPFVVPAGGPDVFRNFVVPIPLNERRYVRALEFRPGNPRVLHHARMLLDDTGDIRRLDDRDPEPGFAGMDVPAGRFPDGHFLGWSPGRGPDKEPFQWPLEPGTDFVIQMHLKPSGRSEFVQASIGLYFTDDPPAKTPIMLRLGSKTIDIPAGEPMYEVRDTFELPVDVTVLSVYPHAHYLAKDMLVRAIARDGTTDTLLRIPNWNFNWQDEYEYSQPIDLPRGTTIEMRYRYDNTADNEHNPSAPPRRVVFGSETTDEMGELLVQVLTRTPDDYAKLRAEASRKNLLTDVAGEEKRVADAPGDYEARNALGAGYAQLGRVQDAIAQLNASLALAPDHAVAYYNRGVIALREQRVAEAIADFERALKARPEYAEAHNNLGVILEARGQLPEAETHYRAALAERPSNSAAHNNLGRLLLARRNAGEAADHFRAALRSWPDNPDALYNLGRILAAQAREREAIQMWRRALAVRPDSVPTLIDLAWLLATNFRVEDSAESLKVAARANDLTGGNNPAALDVLAAAYASQGRFDLASRTAQKAFQRALTLKNSDLAAAIRQRLESYREAEGGADQRTIP